MSRWCHPTISSSVTPFSCPQSFPASGSFIMSWLFASGGQIIGASASASGPPVDIRSWFLLGLTDLISLLSKGFSRVFSSTTIQKHHKRQLVCSKTKQNKTKQKQKQTNDRLVCYWTQVLMFLMHSEVKLKHWCLELRKICCKDLARRAGSSCSNDQNSLDGFQARVFKDNVRGESLRICDQLMALLIGWWWGNRVIVLESQPSDSNQSGICKLVVSMQSPSSTWIGVLISVE